MNKAKFYDYLKRYIMLAIGLSMIALAVSIITRTDFGSSPVQSLAFVFSKKFSAYVTFGTCSFLWNCILIVIQIIILKKDYKIFQLLQIPLSFFFGTMVDLTGLLAEPFFYNGLGLPFRIGYLALGLVILSIGIYITVKADVLMNSPEATTLAVSKKLNLSYGKCKMICDGITVLGAITFSLIFFGRYRFDIIGIATICTVVIPSFLIDLIAKIDKKLSKKNIA